MNRTKEIIIIALGSILTISAISFVTPQAFAAGENCQHTPQTGNCHAPAWGGRPSCHAAEESNPNTLGCKEFYPADGFTARIHVEGCPQSNSESCLENRENLQQGNR